MKLLLVILSACIAVHVQAEEPEEDGKIVGGVAVSIDQYPHQVALLSSNQAFCGGSRISNKWVVTAAHCVAGMSASSIRIRAGSSDYAAGGQVLSVAQIVPHRSYNSRTSDYDIALIRVSGTITAGRAVALANSELPAGRNVVVTGWGAQRTGGTMTRSLRGVQLKTISRADCNKAYSNGITNRMICATASGKDSCQGDSGGPLVANGVLYGVVSFGRECASSKYPGVYANVANLRSFIRDNARV